MKQILLSLVSLGLFACGEREVELQVGERLKDAIESTPTHRQKIQEIDERVGYQEQIEQNEKLEQKKRESLRLSALQPRELDSPSLLEITSSEFDDYSSIQIVGESFDFPSFELSYRQSPHREIHSFEEGRLSFHPRARATLKEPIYILAQDQFLLRESEVIDTQGRDITIVAHRVDIRGRIQTRGPQTKNPQPAGRIRIAGYAVEIAETAELDDLGNPISQTELQACLMAELKKMAPEIEREILERDFLAVTTFSNFYEVFHPPLMPAAERELFNRAASSVYITSQIPKSFFDMPHTGVDHDPHRNWPNPNKRFTTQWNLPVSFQFKDEVAFVSRGGLEIVSGLHFEATSLRQVAKLARSDESKTKKTASTQKILGSDPILRFSPTQIVVFDKRSDTNSKRDREMVDYHRYYFQFPSSRVSEEEVYRGPVIFPYIMRWAGGDSYHSWVAPEEVVVEARFDETIDSLDLNCDLDLSEGLPETPESVMLQENVGDRLTRLAEAWMLPSQHLPASFGVETR